MTDSRELFDTNNGIKLLDELGIDHAFIDEPLVINWLSIAQLKTHGGGYLMGGGETECLREVTLLMNAFNIRYTIVREFVY